MNTDTTYNEFSVDDILIYYNDTYYIESISQIETFPDDPYFTTIANTSPEYAHFCKKGFSYTELVDLISSGKIKHYKPV